MLKKNFVRAGFLSPGLLFFFPYSTVQQVQSNQEPSLVSFHSVSVPADTAGNIKDTLSIPVEVPKIGLNRQAMQFASSFVKKEDEFLQKMKDRSPSYFRVINGVFEKFELPVELRYLAIVESQLRTNAMSPMGARGLWQFMPATAKEMGLKITAKNDERLHFYKSTVAAAKYLKSLYAEFNDWLLVLAAYNGGPGTVYKAIKKAGSRNFWSLQRFLPEESRVHVKRFIGVHYYFEGCGSSVTQTRSEMLAYQKLLENQPTVTSSKIGDTVRYVAMATPSK